MGLRLLEDIAFDLKISVEHINKLIAKAYIKPHQTNRNGEITYMLDAEMVKRIKLMRDKELEDSAFKVKKISTFETCSKSLPTINNYKKSSFHQFASKRMGG